MSRGGWDAAAASECGAAAAGAAAEGQGLDVAGDRPAGGLRVCDGGADRTAWLPAAGARRWLGAGPGRLTLADRGEITVGLHAGESFTVIAARLAVAGPAGSREGAADGGRGAHRAGGGALAAA